MNPSILLSPNTALAESVKKDLSKYTSWRVVEIFGHNLIQTSYEYKPSWIAKMLFEKSALSSEGGRKKAAFGDRPMSEEDWAAVAVADGLPPKIPVSVWAIRAIEEQRTILNRTLWNTKLYNNVESVICSVELSRDGEYKPSLFEGPPGASKTFSVLVTMAILGRPVMMVAGNPSPSGDVDRELLRGGTGAVIRDRPETMREQAKHGVFRNHTAQGEYYRQVYKAMKEAGTDDFCRGHDMLSMEALQIIADKEGLPGAGSVSYFQFGKAEIGRLNGAMVCLDEVNVFHPSKFVTLEQYLSEKGAHNPPNTQWSMTANPAVDGNVNRVQLSQPLLDRSDRRTVSAMTGEEYGQMISAELGVAQPFFVESHGKQVDVRDELRRLFKEEGLDDHTIESLMPAPAGSLFISGFLSPESGLKLANRLGTFHSEVEQKARHGGPFNAASHGLEQQQDTVSFRRLDAMLKQWSTKVYNLALTEAKGCHATVGSHVTAKIMAEGLSYALKRQYVDVFSYRAETSNSQFKAGGTATLNTASLVDEMLIENNLSPDLIQKVLKMTVLKTPAFLAFAATVFGPNPSSAQVTGLWDGIKENVKDTPPEMLVFDRAKNRIQKIELTPVTEFERIPVDLSEPVDSNKLDELVKRLSRSGAIGNNKAVVFFTEKGPYIAYRTTSQQPPSGTSSENKPRLCTQAIAANVLESFQITRGTFRDDQNQSHAASYYLSEVIVPEVVGCAVPISLAGATPSTVAAQVVPAATHEPPPDAFSPSPSPRSSAKRPARVGTLPASNPQSAGSEDLFSSHSFGG